MFSFNETANFSTREQACGMFTFPLGRELFLACLCTGCLAVPVERMSVGKVFVLFFFKNLKTREKMKKFGFMGIMTVMMLVVGLAFSACSSDDDDNESEGSNGSGSSVSGTVVGSWKLQKVVWNDEGETGVDDYSDGNPDDGLDNYLFITDTEWTFSEDFERKSTETFPYIAKNGCVYFATKEYESQLTEDDIQYKYRFSGSQLVIIDEYDGGRDEYYYNRMN